MTLKVIVGQWKGQCELWEDPQGNVVQNSECSMQVEEHSLSYQWSYQGKAHQGELKLRPDGADFSDTWHQESTIAGQLVSTPSLATVHYNYMETWGWRINVCHREPTGEAVVQMTNIAPWGEEARAVRMTFTRVA